MFSGFRYCLILPERRFAKVFPLYIWQAIIRTMTARAGMGIYYEKPLPTHGRGFLSYSRELKRNDHFTPQTFGKFWFIQ